MMSVVNGNLPHGEIIKASGKELLGELYEIYYGNRFKILKRNFLNIFKDLLKIKLLEISKIPETCDCCLICWPPPLVLHHL